MTMAQKRALPEDSKAPFLGVREAAALLACSPSKIVKMRKAGELPNQQGWTREQLLGAARARAERPPKPRGRGLKLDLGQPVKKKTLGEAGAVSSSGGEVATEPTKKPGAPPPPVKKAGGGFLEGLTRDLGALLGDEDEDGA